MFLCGTKMLHYSECMHDLSVIHGSNASVRHKLSTVCHESWWNCESCSGDTVCGETWHLTPLLSQCHSMHPHSCIHQPLTPTYFPLSSSPPPSLSRHHQSQWPGLPSPPPCSFTFMQPWCLVIRGLVSFHHSQFTHHLFYLQPTFLHLSSICLIQEHTPQTLTHTDQLSMFHQYLLWQFRFHIQASLHFSLLQFLHCVSVSTTYRT